jgi:septum formation protein
MLCAHLKKLKQFQIRLASSSPRRRSLISENIGLSFEIELPTFEENLDKTLCGTPEIYVSQTSKIKCLDIVSKHEKSEFSQPVLIISADTIIAHDNDILEKPVDSNCAFQMLRKLSGKEHKVLTAVTIAYRASATSEFTLHTFCESTTVQFCHLSDQTIHSYVDSGEPFDKAGGYGIQGLGSSFVSRLYGCYFNVVGFPVNRFCVELIDILKNVL